MHYEYLLDKNYNLVSYDGSVFSNVIPFTIGDTGGGGQGVVTRVYQIGTIFKDKLYIGARINNISGIFSLDNQNISQFIFNPNSAIEKKEYFSILISNCVAVEKNKR